MIYPKYFQAFFKQEINQPYFLELLKKYQKRKSESIVYPKEENIFAAFNYFDVNNLKVVIIGQDPYYKENMANGLAFAVNEDVEIPKSLKNIFQEVINEYGWVNTDKTLIPWAKQGVLLINSSLTVTKDHPNSHQNIGWKTFIEHLMQYLALNTKHIVYILWGNNAKSYRTWINARYNLILTSAHPSPLSASYGFFYNNHFKEANAYLIEHNKEPIKW